MSQISFRVVSVELKDSTLNELNPQNHFRLNLTQRPHHIRQEYIVNDSDELRNINHEWSIDNSKNQVEKVTLTLRTIQRKDMACDNENQNSENINSVNDDHSNVSSEYTESKRSLIGYCNININSLHKNICNDITVQLLTRVNVKIVGYVHLQIDMWENEKKLLKKEMRLKNKKKNVFSSSKRREYSNLI